MATTVYPNSDIYSPVAVSRAVPFPDLDESSEHGSDDSRGDLLDEVSPSPPSSRLFSSHGSASGPSEPSINGLNASAFDSDAERAPYPLAPLGFSRRHDLEDLKFRSLSQRSSLGSSASVPPSNGRAVRASTQLATHMSKAMAAKNRLSAGYLGAHDSMLPAVQKRAGAPHVLAHCPNAEELEVWTEANVSPVVFERRNFAGKVSKDAMKDAVAFNLRHLASEIILGSSDAKRPHKRHNIATPEISRTSRVDSIIRDVLPLDEQMLVDGSDSTRSNSEEAKQWADTLYDTTYPDNRTSTEPVRASHSRDGRSTSRNPFLSLKGQRLPYVSSNPPSETSTTNRTPSRTPSAVQDSVVSTDSPPSSHEDLYRKRQALFGESSRVHALEERVPREPSVEMMELISPAVIASMADEDAKSPSGPDLFAIPSYGDVTTAGLRTTPDKRSPYSRTGSPPSSLFDGADNPSSSIGPPSTQEILFEDNMHDAPVFSASASDIDSGIETEEYPTRFFHDCSMQPSDGNSDATVLTQKPVFCNSTPRLYSNSELPNASSWPSLLASEDHPYLQEARQLMVIAKMGVQSEAGDVEDIEMDAVDDENDDVENISQFEEEGELDWDEDMDAIESDGTNDELDTLSVLVSPPMASDRHNTSLPGWNSVVTTPARPRQRVTMPGSISSNPVASRNTGANQKSTLAHYAKSPSVNDSDDITEGDDEIDYEDQLDDWTSSLQTLVKGKRVLSPEELLNLKTVLNAVHTHSSSILPSSDLAQTVLQVAKLEARDVPNQDSLNLRSLARKSLRAWGLSTRTNS